jgi:hypothetical protein
MAKQVLAWHFVGDTLRDGSPVPADGVWLKHDGPVELCVSGFHASLNPFDALQYAPGPILCRVALRGEIRHGDDKLVASEQMIISRIDATALLNYFARMQAVSVVHLWDAPEIVLDYLMTGDKSLRAAARDAAKAAAGAAARDAARAAARDAAWATAWDAARDAAWDAAWDAAKKEFTDWVNECFEVTK